MANEIIRIYIFLHMNIMRRNIYTMNTENIRRLSHGNSMQFANCAITPNEEFIMSEVPQKNQNAVRELIRNKSWIYERMINNEIVKDLVNSEHDFGDLLMNTNEYKASGKYDFNRRKKLYLDEKLEEVRRKNPDIDVSELYNRLQPEEKSTANADFMRILGNDTSQHEVNSDANFMNAMSRGI